MRVVTGTIPAELALPTVAIADDSGRPRKPLAAPHGPLARLRGLDGLRLRVALHRAGLDWLDQRTDRAADAIGKVGADQALYMAVMDALGCVENRVGFLDLTWSLPVVLLQARGSTVPGPDRAWLYRDLLLAGSGLGPMTRDWTFLMETEPMEPGSWRTAGVRPQNHPLRRVEAAVELIARWIPEGISKGIASTAEEGIKPLIAPLRVESREGASLVGEGRARQIGVNAVLPVLLAMARERGDRAWTSRLKGLFESFPQLPHNGLTREAARLIGGAAVGRLGACEQ
jgi:hypothetical protein